MGEPIDLSTLPAPKVVEHLDFETVFAELLTDLEQRDPAFSALLESDPAIAELEATAYRETLLRARVNDAAQAVLLPHAAGSDLDNVGALFNVARLVVTPADDSTVPPTPAIMETDEPFRRRVQLAMEAISTAGSRESYVFHALSASANVRDVVAISPGPSEVNVIVMSHDNGGHADVALRQTVAGAVSAEAVRPLGDRVNVRSAQIVNFTVSAALIVAPGPDAELVRSAAVDAVNELMAQARPIGEAITVSAIHAALHQPGVKRVTLTSPSSDIEIGEDQAARMTALTISVEAP